MKFGGIGPVAFSGDGERGRCGLRHRQVGANAFGQQRDETEIFHAEVEGERRVVVSGKDRRCVVAHHEAVTDTLLDGVPQRVECDTVGHSNREALAHCRSRDEPQLIRHELHDVPGAESTAMHDKTEVGEDVSHFGNGFIIAADEQRELAIAGSVNSTGHGRVHHAHPDRRQRGELGNELASVGRQIDPNRTWPQSTERPGVASHDGVDVIGSRERGQEHVGLGGTRCRRVGRGRPGPYDVG